MNLAIVTGTWSHYGGITSYVYHFMQGIKAHDVEAYIVTAGSACKYWKEKLPFTDERYLNDADLIFLVHFYPVFHTLDHQRHILGKIKKSGKPLVVLLCDPGEWQWGGATEVMKFLNPSQIIFIGEQNRNLYYRFHKDWISRARLKVFGLPYERWNTGPKEWVKNGRAICTSRISIEKRLELIVAAGDIEIWSSHPGPQSFYLVDQWGTADDIPGWKGGFENEKEDYDKVYGTASALVDMSRIGGEGGRVQYTYLEAMDYGLDLICASDWEVDPELSEFLPGIHYHPALEPDAIKAYINKIRHAENAHRAAHLVLLEEHRAERVVGEVLKAWEPLRK